MIRLALLLTLQAAALAAGWPALAPAAALGAGWLLTRPEASRRVRLGFVLFASFFIGLSVMAAAEQSLGLSGRPDFRAFAVLSLRGFASFLVAVAGARMFTLLEILCFLKRLRVPGYILTMTYLMVQDLAVVGRLAAATAETSRARGAGVRGLARVRLSARAAGNLIVTAAGRFRYRHEHMDARGVTIDLPFEEWRAYERIRTS
jgi:hypothetical protein